MTASTGGMIVHLRRPRGASTHTNAAPRSAYQRQRVARAALTVAPRRGGAARPPPGAGRGARRAASSSSRLVLAGRERRARAAAGRRRACRPARQRLDALERALGQRALEPRRRGARGRGRRTRPPRAGRAAASPRGAAWRESSRCSLTSKREARRGSCSCPAGRRVLGGQRVEGRVDLHRLEALGVPGQAVAGGHPLGYHSATKPGSAQLEVPTTMCPSIWPTPTHWAHTPHARTGAGARSTATRPTRAASTSATTASAARPPRSPIAPEIPPTRTGPSRNPK